MTRSLFDKRKTLHPTRMSAIGVALMVCLFRLASALPAAPDDSMLQLSHNTLNYALRNATSFDATANSTAISLSNGSRWLLPDGSLQLTQMSNSSAWLGSASFQLPYFRWRIELEIETYYKTDGTSCGFFGFYVHNVIKPILNLNGSIRTSAGNIFWLSLCASPNASMWLTKTFTGQTLISPLAKVTQVACYECAAMLDSSGYGRFAVVVLYDFQVKIVMRKLNSPSLGEPIECFHQVDISILEKDYLTIFGLNGVAGDVRINKFYCWEWSLTATPYSFQKTRPSKNLLTFISDFSFSNATSSTAASNWNSSGTATYAPLSTVGLNKNALLLAEKNQSSFGRYTSPTRLPQNMSNIRIEILLQLNMQGAILDGAYFYLSIHHHSTAPQLQFNLSDFQGFFVGVHVKKKASTWVGYPYVYWTGDTIVANPMNESFVASCGDCIFFDGPSNPREYALIVEVNDDQITVTIDNGPDIGHTCWQNVPITGFSAMVATGNSSLSIGGSIFDTCNCIAMGAVSLSFYSQAPLSSTTAVTSSSEAPLSSSTAVTSTSTRTTSTPQSTTETGSTSANTPVTTSTSTESTSASTSGIPSSATLTSTSNVAMTSTTAEASTTPYFSQTTTYIEQPTTTTYVDTVPSSTTTAMSFYTTSVDYVPTTTEPTPVGSVTEEITGSSDFTTELAPVGSATEEATTSSETPAHATSSITNTAVIPNITTQQSIDSVTSPSTSTKMTEPAVVEKAEVDEYSYADASDENIRVRKYSAPEIRAILSFTLKNAFGFPTILAPLSAPQVKIEDLEPCPYIRPKNRSPNYGTRIFMTFSVEKLLATNENKKDATFWASILLQWKVDVCPDNVTAKQAKIADTVFSGSKETLWKPHMMFSNSSESFTMAGDNVENVMLVSCYPDRPNRTLYFHWNRLGALTTLCHFNLKDHPYDKMQCDFTFFFLESAQLVKFAALYLNLVYSSLNVSEEWLFVSSKSKIFYGPSLLYQSETSSFLKISLTFQRRPGYFIANWLAPCYVLIGMILASFVSPASIDRAAFTATLMLSIMMTQTIIGQTIPTTADTTMFADYIQVLIGLGACITLYHVISSAFPERIFSSTICRGKFSVARFCDLIVFLLSIGYLIAANAWIVFSVL